MFAKRLVLSALAALFFIYLTGCGGGSQPISIAITASSTTVDGVSGNTVSLTATVLHDSGAGGVNWTVSGGGTISGKGTSATYTPPVAGKSAIKATITATSVTDSTKTASVSITIPATAAISTTSITGGIVGTAYNITLAASGGMSPYTWSITNGTLPAGLTMSSSGAITGTPMAGAVGSSTLTFKVTDSGKPNPLTATTDLTVTVAAAPAITFGTGNPADGTLNVAYTGAITATGGAGTLTYAIASGAFPDGISMSPAGALSGTPTKAGTFAVSVRASDAFGDSATQAYTIKIGYPALKVTALTPPTGYVGSSYTQTALAATGGSGTGYTWAVSSGSALPGGLVLSPAGVITGKPTTAGDVSTSVTVTDSVSNTATGSLSFTIKPAVSITTIATLPTGYVGSNYSQTLAATGGSGSGYTWAVASGSSLPGGLNLSSAGVLSGTPTTAATSSFGITVADSASNSASVTFSLTVSPGITIGAITLPRGYEGTAYPGATFTATGGSGTGYSWSWAAASGSSLPAGLNLSTAGVISGTPSSPGSFSVVVTVADSASNKASRTLPLTVEGTLAITSPATLASGTVQVGYSTTLAASGGSGTYTSWTVTQGASGLQTLNLSLSPAGVLSGTPTVTGSATFTVQVTDSEGHTATKSLTVAVYSVLTITTTSLPAANVGTAYSQTLAAGGGTGTGYTWTASNSNLATYGLSLSTAGVVSGTPTSAGTASFTPKVTDSGNNTATASAPLSITIYAGLSLPANPNTLPTTGTTGVPYTGSIDASGGSGNYCWTVTGLPSDNLSAPAPNAPCGYIAASLPIAGTPSSPATVSFTVKVTDTATNASVSVTYTITVSNPAPLTFTTSATLPDGTVSQVYSQSIAATGGVGPYTWAINGNTIPNTGAAQALSNGLTVASTGTLTLAIGGTPTATGSVTFTVKITDSQNHSVGPTQFSIQVDAAGQPVSGHISLMNTCGNITLPQITLTINTNPVQTATTDSNGNYTFAAIPNGTYTLTPSITGASSLFTPASYSIQVNNNSVTGEDFNVSLGYTVSGTVSYSGGKPGPIYLTLNSNDCGGASYGTAISAPGAFTIRGVTPDNYTLTARRDNLGFGQPNASNPTGGLSNITVSANVTGETIMLADPGAVALSSGTAPGLQGGGGFSKGAVLGFKAITDSNGVETPASYTVQWSTSNSVNNSGAFTSTAGNTSFPASGANGNNVWFVSTDNVSGLSPGSAYYFQAQGVAGSSTSGWSTPIGPITVGAPSSGNTVTGQVTWTGAAAGPLYVGFYQQQSNGSIRVYAMQIGTRTNPPTSPANFTVMVPSGTYYFFGILDQNHDGLIDSGDMTNTNGGNGPPPVTISGNTTQPTLALPNVNSQATVTTTFSQTDNGTNTSTSYSLNFKVRGMNKLPIAVALTSGPNVIQPVDMGMCQNCGTPSAQYYVNLGATAPKVGDSYGFNVTYSDGTTGTVNGAVTGVLGASALPTLSSPIGSNVSDTPNFDWNYPANAANYTYQFSVCCGTNGTIWQVPGQNSNANGFTSTQIAPPLVWGTDPTDSNNKPNPTSLSAGNFYSWSIQAQDNNGNSAQAQAQFSTTPVALTLPAANPTSLPSAIVSTAYNGSIAATGGTQPYQWTVTGLPDDNLNWGYSNNCGCVTITGTPNSVTTSGNPVSFQVTVHDNNGQSYGPVTYTIAVNSYTPISLPAANTNPLGSALVGNTYAGNVNASGGSGGGNYSFSVNGTAIPTNNTATAIANGGGLTATNSGGNTLFFGGIPAAVGTISLDVIVTDTANSGNTAEATYTVSVINGPNGANNGRLKGTYSCLVQGYNDADGSRWASLANVVADGSGKISSGVWDMNGRDLPAAMSGTLSGTYSVGSDNQGIMSLSSLVTSGGTGTHPSTWAIALTGSGSTAGTFRMVESDDTGASPSGQHAQAKCYQDTTSAFAASTMNNNSFAFGIEGEDNGGVYKAAVGRFSASGGNLSSGYLDGMKLSQTADNGGSFTGTYGATVDAGGRVTLALATSKGTLNFVSYIVDANRMFLLETDAANGLFAGELRRQQNTGNYTAAGLSGAAVIYAQGMTYASASPGFSNDYASMLMQVSGGGNGNITVHQSYQDENSNGTVTYSNNVANGAVIPVTFDSTNLGRATFSPGSDSAYLYFFDTNNAFMLDLNGNQGWLQTGWMQPQSSLTFNDANIAATYMMGQMPRLQPAAGASVGWVNLTSAGGLTGGISDAGENSFRYDQSLSGTYAWDSATYGTFTVTTANGGLSCVVGSANPLSVICTLQSDSEPSILIFQQ